MANRLQCEESFSTGLNDGESVSFGDITFYGVPAKHNEIERNEKGQCVYMGYVIKIGPYTIYHSGDTLWFDELVPLLRPFHVDVAILPDNGNKPERRVAGNLNSSEAVKLAKEINAARVTPCHYDMFTFNTADVNEFIQEAITAAQAYHVLQPGERLSINL